MEGTMPKKAEPGSRKPAGRGDVFRLAGAVERDPAVEFWLGVGPPELRAIARAWFERMRECGGDVRELVHDGGPVACVGDVPFAYVNTFKDHVNVGFFRGALLADPSRLLVGGGKRMRHVKLGPGRPLQAADLEALIRAAYRDAKSVPAESGDAK
jgi:hypothetical protein